MQKILKEIQSGKFAREWIKESRTGMKRYHRLLKKGEKHPIEKTGQRLSPCVEIDGVMLPDISGAEVEQYLLANKLVVPNDKAPSVPIDAACTDAEHEKMRVKTVRFF